MAVNELRCKDCGTKFCTLHPNGQVQIKERNTVTVTPQDGKLEITCRNGHKNSIDLKKPNK